MTDDEPRPRPEPVDLERAPHRRNPGVLSPASEAELRAEIHNVRRALGCFLRVAELTDAAQETPALLPTLYAMQNVLDGNVLTGQPAPWDPNFPEDALCRCGHEYERHFDSHDDMEPVGCKYCECEIFRCPAEVQVPDALQAVGILALVIFKADGRAIDGEQAKLALNHLNALGKAVGLTQEQLHHCTGAMRPANH